MGILEKLGRELGFSAFVCSYLRKRFCSERSERGSRTYLMQIAKKGRKSITVLDFIKIVRRQFAAFCSECSERGSKMRPSKLPRKGASKDVK